MNNLRINNNKPDIIVYDGSVLGSSLQILEENEFHFKVKSENTGIFFLPKMLVKDGRITKTVR